MSAITIEYVAQAVDDLARMIAADVVDKMATKEELQRLRDEFRDDLRGFRSEVNERFDVVDRRLDGIDYRLDRMEMVTFEDHRRRIETIERAIGLS